METISMTKKKNLHPILCVNEIELDKAESSSCNHKPTSTTSSRHPHFHMATIFSPSAIFSPTTSSSYTPPPKSPPKHNHLTTPTTTTPKSSSTTILTTTIATAAALILSTTPPSLADPTSPSYTLYYGTAASASSYGGFGGNSDKKASAEYTYDVPEGWKERLVTKVQKGTNGTDSEFFNPKKKAEKEYLTFLAGYKQLAPRATVLDNLALSDVDLQDLIATADSVKSEETKKENGQVYYVYEIDGVGAHSLIAVTCANNKLYAHFVNAPMPEWKRDEGMLRHVHESFKTVGYF